MRKGGVAAGPSTKRQSERVPLPVVGSLYESKRSDRESRPRKMGGKGGEGIFKMLQG